MISLFEVALEELEANFHISPVSTHRLSRLAGGFYLQPWRGRARGGGSFSNEPPTFTLFPAASAEARPRLPVWNLPEIILARARGDSSRAAASICGAIRSPGGVATPLASLVTFKLPKPARSFRGLHESSLSRPVASCRDATRRDATLQPATLASLQPRIKRRNCSECIALSSGISREFLRGHNEPSLCASWLKNADTISHCA